jgi:hypothetical protein
MNDTTQQIVNKAWNLARVLRDDGQKIADNLQTALDQINGVLEGLKR